MSGTVCPSCGNWRAHDGFPGNHDPDCLFDVSDSDLIDRVDDWSDNFEYTGNVVRELDANNLLGELARRWRVAAALNGTPDLTALAEALARYEKAEWRTTFPRERDLLAAARALVASTSGTPDLTDDTEPTYDYPHSGTCDACAEGPLPLREDDPVSEAWICEVCSDREIAATRAAATAMHVPYSVAAAGVAAFDALVASTGTETGQ